MDIILYLDEDNEEVYGIFRTLILFLTEDFFLEPILMVELIKSSKLNMQEAMIDLSTIHSSYYNLINTLRTPQESK